MITNSTPDYPENAYIPPIPPEDQLYARTAAFEEANYECVVKKPDCLTVALFAHQKQLRILSPDYTHAIDGVLQTSDNLVICCKNCHRWIHENEQEATELGYLNR